MKPKKTNIKIKHHKYNLYNRRKSRGKQVLTVILMVVIVAALAVVGYGAGKPLVEYITSKNSETSESTPSWTPPATSEAESNVTSDEQTSELVETSDTSAPAKAEETISSMYVLPGDAVYDAASLKSAVVSAKNAGYTGIVITAKDSTGNILYKSNIDEVKDGATITGTLSAKQMCDIITAEGLVPAARFSTLLDRSNGNSVGGGYMLSDGGGNWFDAAPANGGKKWLSPFSSASAEFMKNIAAELSSAGFKYIIAADTMYPDFRPSDISSYLYDLPLTDTNKRVAALWDVLDVAKAGAEDNGAKLIAELDGAALFADDRQATDAEFAADKDKLAGVGVLIDYTPESGSAYAEAKTFIGRMGAQFKGQEYSVLVDGSAVSPGTIEEIQRAFTEAGVSMFVK